MGPESSPNEECTGKVEELQESPRKDRGVSRVDSLQRLFKAQQHRIKQRLRHYKSVAELFKTDQRREVIADMECEKHIGSICRTSAMGKRRKSLSEYDGEKE